MTQDHNIALGGDAFVYRVAGTEGLLLLPLPDHPIAYGPMGGGIGDNEPE